MVFNKNWFSPWLAFCVLITCLPYNGKIIQRPTDGKELAVNRAMISYEMVNSSQIPIEKNFSISSDINH